MTHTSRDHSDTDHPDEGTNDTMSKLVGALILELADDVPDKPGFETVRADLFAASKVYEHGKKKDLALRFYLAIRSLFHEIERLEELEAGHNKPHQQGSQDNFQPQQQEGYYQQ
jgi:hypothetical protein